MDIQNQNDVPDALAITSADTGAGGIRVVVAIGECFGSSIRWFREETVTATVTSDAKSGLPMLQFRFDGDRSFVAEYRGLEADGLTWWRHAHEADPREYREHCLRVVRLL